MASPRSSQLRVDGARRNARRGGGGGPAERVLAVPLQLEMTAITQAPAKLEPGTWGGRREGAGRRRLSEAERARRRSPMPHLKRPKHRKYQPVHITMRAKSGLPSFRAQLVHGMLVRLLARQVKRKYAKDFHVVHYSIQSNHLHVIIEATDNQTLRSGVSGLVIAFAKRLNKEILGRRIGKVWAERYHSRELTSPREVKNALSYVYNNYKKHGYTVFGAAFVDPLSSALLFDKWSLEVASMPTNPRAPDTPRTWLLREGWWTKHGLLHPFELPASGARRR